MSRFGIAFGVYLCCGVAAPSALAQPPIPPDVWDMVRELDLPGTVGELSFEYRLVPSEVSAPPSDLTAEKAREEAPALEKLADAGKATPQEWVRLIRIRCWLEQYDRAADARQKAAALYREQLARQPENVDALLGLAELLTYTHEAPEAEQLARKALALDPDRAETYLCLAETLYHQSSAYTMHWQKALARASLDLPALISAHSYSTPSLAGAKEIRAFTRELQRRAPERADQIRAIFGELPTDEEVAEAEAAAQRAQEWSPSARAFLRRRLAEEPMPSMFRLCMNCEFALATAPALALGGRISLAGRPVGTDPEGLAIEAAAMRFDQEMLAIGQRICEEHPDDLRHRALVGSMQVAVVYPEIVRTMTEDDDVLRLPKPEYFEPAIANLKAALALPEDERTAVARRLAVLYYIAEDLPATVRVCRRLLEAGHCDVEAISLYSFAKLPVRFRRFATDGISLGRLRRGLPEIEADLSRWVRKAQPPNADAYAILARFRWFLRDWPGAADALARAHELDPDSLTYALGLGVARLRAKQPTDAAAVLAKAVDMLTEDEDEDLASDCHYAYGVALLALGRDDEAQPHLNWTP